MAYSTRLLQPELRTDVLRLWRDNMSDPGVAAVLDERFRWLYERNPAGPAVTVVAVDERTGQVVGCGSAYPRALQVDGKPILAAIAADFAVDRRHRLGGAALAIQRALIEAHRGRVACLFCFPNKTAAPVFRKAGYEPIGTVKGWVKPLRSGYKVRQYVKTAVVAAAVAPVVDVGLMAADTLRAVRLGASAGVVVDRADPRFDELWNLARTDPGVHGNRSAGYLNWRYHEFTTAQYRFFCLECDQDLRGWVIYSARAQKVFVADAFAPASGPGLESLMLAFGREMRRQGFESVSVSCLMNDRMTSMLKALGFFPAASADRELMVGMVNGDGGHHQTVAEAARWAVFDGELDI